MSEKKNSRVLNFIRSNLYYLLIGVALITIVAVTAVVVASNVNKTPQQAEKPPVESSKPQESVKESESTEPESPIESTEPEKPSESEKDPPTDQKIEFVAPVKNASVGKDYTSSTVVFNQTLGVYTGHMGLDFSAEAGSAVVCTYAGKIESITTSYLQGTTVTVDHGNGLKTVYNSIEVKEGLSEGQSIAAGETLGSVSDNNRQEYKDGAHLHFEVLENDVRVDPKKYLNVQNV